MTEETFFSLVMPVYNDEKNVGKAIKSIINQDYKNWELIIIDDGSKDKSYDIAKKFYQNRNVKIFRMEKNKGASSCMNFGVKNAKGNWVGIIDSDATEPRNWLNTANKIIKKDIDIFGGKVDYTIQESKPSYLQRVFYYFESNLYPNEPQIYNNKNFVEPIMAGANFFFTKKVFERLGGFKKNIRVGYDKLFQCQAVEKGFNVFYSPNLTINHPLYNWKTTSNFLKRSIIFTKWKNVRFRYSKLLEKPYRKIPLLISMGIISLISLLYFLGLPNTILFVFYGVFIFFIYQTIRLSKKMPLKYILPYIILNWIKKMIAIIIYLLKLKPKSNHWK